MVFYHRRTRRPWSGVTRVGLLNWAPSLTRPETYLYRLSNSRAVVDAPRFDTLNSPAPWLLETAGLLLLQLNTDHDRTHDVIELEVPLRAVGMVIMAPGTSRCDG